MNVFFINLIDGILVGGVYALLGLGIVLIYKATKIFNFATGEMGVFGAFITWSIMTYLRMPAWISVLAGIAAGFLVGMLVERFAMRKLIGQPIFSALLATLALSVFLRGLEITIWSTNQFAFPEPIFPSQIINMFGVNVAGNLFSAFIVAMLCFGGFSIFFRYTNLGLSMRGVAESHKIAKSLGVKVTVTFALIWSISSMVYTVSALAVADRLELSAFTIPAVALRAFPGVLLGGLESIPGALVGCIIVSILENFSRTYINMSMGDLTPWLVMMMVLIIRPSGLWGLQRIERI